MTVENEAIIFSEEAAQVPAADETPVPDRGEAQMGAEEETPVAPQGETSAEDEIQLVGAEEVPDPAGDESPAPVEDEAQAATHDKVRFFVEDEAPPAAKDETEVEDQLPEPIGESALAAHADEPLVIVEERAPVVPVDEAPIPVREDAQEEESLGRRQHARFVVKGGAKGRVAVVWDAVLLNLSLGGALIEHANVVRPGTPSSLELELQGKKIRLRCRVARSVADRIEKQPDGERELVYRTGLQFVEPSDETLQVIGEYLHLLNEDA